ncbi:MAG TPA: VTT domain-containing protein [archaeon]|nr:VTT domain-containing protein [archaeon]
MFKQKKILKKEVLIAWIAIVIILFIIYLFAPNLLNLEFLNSFVKENKLLVVFLFISIITLISLTLIPSTPFVLSGLLLFSPLETFIYSIIIIILYSTITYYFARYLGLDRYFEKKYPESIKKIRKALKGKEWFIIIGWGFIPIFPTDLVIYMCSSLKIPFRKCLIGVLIGEGTLNALYIFSVGLVFLLI